MKNITSSHVARRGAALVVVLGFVVLLTVVVLAFLSGSLIQRQVSSANSRYFATSDFALGAANSVIGDLQQEIVAGSYAKAAGAGTVYEPIAAADAIPSTTGFTRSPTSGVETDGLNNLVKVSISGQSFFPSGSANYNYGGAASPASPPSRATSIATTQASLNGRSVTLARWNKHLLLTKATPGGTDVTPVAAFPTPDWILVARSGSNPGGTDSTGATIPITGIGDPTNTNYVVGRYAFAVYDEGGLLDANVAGYPSTYPSTTGSGSAITSPVSLTGSAVGAKAAESFADLTQIPTDGGNPTSPASTLAQAPATIDALVGWRNYASLNSLGSTYPSYAPAASANVFYQNVFSDTSGFMNVNRSSSAALTQTDHSFTSRQQLINFFTQDLANVKNGSVPTMQNALQYFTNFSRDLDQPSYWPDPNRPRVPGTWDTTVANNGTYGYFYQYQGNNDTAGVDNQANPINQINPPFPAEVVQTSFPRYDGSTANVGEPLVKKRFPLARLAWLTYLGPSATSFTATTPAYQKAVLSNGITQAEINAGKDGQTGNIYKYFGLTWGQMTGYLPPNYTRPNCWIYNHGAKKIMRLSDVAAAGREPDFFELLKAAINDGSIGKGAAEGRGTYPVQGSFQQGLDCSTDDQIIQIGANIIDQFDPDSYPTQIEFDNSPVGTNQPREFYGIENLPYYLGSVASPYQVAEPSNLPANDPGNVGQIPSSTNCPRPEWFTSGQTPAWTSNPNNLGAAGILIHPIIWNPHDPHSSYGVAGTYPTNFRFNVDTQYNPFGTANSLGAITYYPGSTTAALAIHNTSMSGYNTASASDYYSGVSANSGNELLAAPFAVAYTPKNSEIDFNADPSLVVAGGLDTEFLEPMALRTPGGAEKIKGVGTYAYTLSTVAYNANGPNYLGLYEGQFSLRWVSGGDLLPGSGTPVFPASPPTYVGAVYTTCGAFTSPTAGNVSGVEDTGTIRLDYKDPVVGWKTYDVKYPDQFGGGGNQFLWSINYPDNWMNDNKTAGFYCDPRTSRFGCQGAGGYMSGPTQYNNPPPLSTNGAPTYKDPNLINNVILGIRPTAYGDFWCANVDSPGSGLTGLSPTTLSYMGWFLNYANAANPPIVPWLPPGATTQNSPFVQFNTPSIASGASAYYTDPDGVLRMAMGAHNLVNYLDQAHGQGHVQTPSDDLGLPTVPELGYYYNSGGGGTSQSRPVILNRPFHSVAELGYTFSGTPWKNLNFFMPQSGDAALLDVFCVKENDQEPPSAVESGKVSLNTRQLPVLEAILSGAYRDETSNTQNSVNNNEPPLTTVEAKNIATALISRTSADPAANPNKGPLLNVSELVGKYVTGKNPQVDLIASYYSAENATVGGYYDGFTNDLSNLNATITTAPFVDGSTFSHYIKRYIESPIRALSDVGMTRTWNLMIDVVAQTGRYPTTAASADQFIVQGEQHYWVHVAIDRYTGNVIDENVEVVRE